MKSSLYIQFLSDRKYEEYIIFREKYHNFYLISWLNKPDSGLRRQMRGHDGIGLLSSDLFLSHYYSVSDDGDESVNVGSQIDLYNVPLFESHVGIVVQRRKVADAIVHGNAARKRDALQNLLVLLEGLCGLLLQSGVALRADLAD